MGIHGAVFLPNEKTEKKTEVTDMDGVPYMPWDNTVTSYLSNYYNMQFDNMKAQLHNNLKTLLNNRGNKDAGKIQSDHIMW